STKNAGSVQLVTLSEPISIAGNVYTTSASGRGGNVNLIAGLSSDSGLVGVVGNFSKVQTGSAQDTGGNILLEVMLGDDGIGSATPGNAGQSGITLDTSSGRLGGNVVGFVGGNVNAHLSATTGGDQAGNIYLSSGGALNLSGGNGLVAAGGS